MDIEFIRPLRVLEDRLRAAIECLEDVQEDKCKKGRQDQYEWNEFIRVSGKIDGVKLALSFLNDEIGYQKVKDASSREYAYALCSCCDSKRDISGACTSADPCEYCDSKCGDWPAPCNCEDPRTHNGH